MTQSAVLQILQSLVQAVNTIGNLGASYATVANPTFTGTITAPSVTFNSTSGIIGVTNASNAAAGSVGEYISSTIASGSAISLTSGTATNVTSISLTAGDWQVSGVIGLALAGTTTLSSFSGGINTVSATIGALSTATGSFARNTAFTTGQSEIIPTGEVRLSLSATTTVYLVTQATFAVSTCAAYGYIAARRAR